MLEGDERRPVVVYVDIDSPDSIGPILAHHEDITKHPRSEKQQGELCRRAGEQTMFTSKCPMKARPRANGFGGVGYSSWWLCDRHGGQIEHVLNADSHIFETWASMSGSWASRFERETCTKDTRYQETSE